MCALRYEHTRTAAEAHEDCLHRAKLPVRRLQQPAQKRVSKAGAQLCKGPEAHPGILLPPVSAAPNPAKRLGGARHLQSHAVLGGLFQRLVALCFLGCIADTTQAATKICCLSSVHMLLAPAQPRTARCAPRLFSVRRLGGRSSQRLDSGDCTRFRGQSKAACPATSPGQPSMARPSLQLYHVPWQDSGEASCCTDLTSCRAVHGAGCGCRSDERTALLQQLQGLRTCAAGLPAFRSTPACLPCCAQQISSCCSCFGCMVSELCRVEGVSSAH